MNVFNCSMRCLFLYFCETFQWLKVFFPTSFMLLILIILTWIAWWTYLQHVLTPFISRITYQYCVASNVNGQNLICYFHTVEVIQYESNLQIELKEEKLTSNSVHFVLITSVSEVNLAAFAYRLRYFMKISLHSSEQNVALTSKEESSRDSL